MVILSYLGNYGYAIRYGASILSLQNTYQN